MMVQFSEIIVKFDSHYPYSNNMLLSKEIAVYLNLASCRMKQYTANVLKQNEVNLTPEQFLLIDLLWNHGSMSQQKLADMMHKDKNSITKLVDGLEKKRLVVRRQDKNDRRSNLIVLTPTADGMKLEAKEKGVTMLDDILKGITEEELRSFLSTLDKITKNMDELEK